MSAFSFSATIYLWTEQSHCLNGIFRGVIPDFVKNITAAVAMKKSRLDVSLITTQKREDAETHNGWVTTKNAWKIGMVKEVKLHGYGTDIWNISYALES